MNSIDEKANEIIKDMSLFAEKYFNNMDDRTCPNEPSFNTPMT